MNPNHQVSITQANHLVGRVLPGGPDGPRHWVNLSQCLVIALSLCLAQFVFANTPDLREQRSAGMFQQAWHSARSGNRERFEELGPQISDYLLYPYWQYEDYRHRRGSVAPAEMAAFLKEYEDWAFSGGLKTAWLKTLGRNKQWQALEQYNDGSQNTEIRCYTARAKLALNNTEGLLAEAQRLWAVGKSQPKACDPLFAWLRKNDGITTALAWERIRLAMAAGNPRLTVYLGRYLPPEDRDWLSKWQTQNRERYRNLDKARRWEDNELSRMITLESLKTLADRDAGEAMEAFAALDGGFDWPADQRGDVMRRIGLMAAVALEEGAGEFIASVPKESRDDQLYQWWARFNMANNDWPAVLAAIEGQSSEAIDDDRWRYWSARAQLESGDKDAGTAALQDLAQRTNYYGFLSADHLETPYTICPREPQVSEQQIEALAARDDFSRALELHAVGLSNWALAEWSRATARLPVDELKVAAGLARDNGWYDRAIFALGNSGELSFYEWRFPVIYEEPVMQAAVEHDLDPAWIYGIMRSESAMTETARSSAGALGLMQVLPVTAKDISRQHGLPYRQSAQLLEGPVNVAFGTVYLRQLLDEHRQSPVLVSGAYNAGPNAVARWLDTRPIDDPAIWIETLPYYETRDYIPRVLTFTTLYDWRLGNPVPRISSRMPAIESGTMNTSETAQVVCRPLIDEAEIAGP